MIKSNKENFREYFLAKRLRLDKKSVFENSRKIAQKLLSIEQITNKKNFGVYLSVKNEVDLNYLIDTLIFLDKKVYAPRYFKDYGYFFVKFDGWKNLDMGPYKILQPTVKDKVKIHYLEVVFIPGLAFDKEGFRLGYGKGIYDKLLAKFNGVKVGVCFDFQIVDLLPAYAHDTKVDLIVCEKRIERVNFI